MDGHWLDGLPDLDFPEFQQQKRGHPSRKLNSSEFYPKDLPETRGDLNRWASDSAKCSFLCSAARRLFERVVQYDACWLNVAPDSPVQEHVDSLLELQGMQDYRTSHPCPVLFLGGYPARTDLDVKCTLLAVYHDALVSGGKEIVTDGVKSLHPTLLDDLRRYTAQLSMSPGGAAILDGFLAEVRTAVSNDHEPLNVSATKAEKERWYWVWYEKTVKAFVEALLKHFDRR